MDKLSRKAIISEVKTRLDIFGYFLHTFGLVFDGFVWFQMDWILMDINGWIRILLNWIGLVWT